MAEGQLVDDVVQPVSDDEPVSVDEAESVDTSDDDEPATSGRGAARLARREAKALARLKRSEAREKLAAAKAQARTDEQAAKAAARVDSETAEQVSPEVLELTNDESPITERSIAEDAPVEKPSASITPDRAPKTPHAPTSDDAASSRIDPVALAAAATPDEVDVEVPPVARSTSGRGFRKNAPLDFAKFELERVESGEAERDARAKEAEKQAREQAEAEAAAEAKLAAKAARREGKEAAGRERAEAKAAAQQAKLASREAKKADQADKDDHIVEPPREPKVPIADKVRAVRPKRPAPTPSTAKAPGGEAASGRHRTVISVLAGVIGAVGLVCSVVLAFGALLVALNADGGSVYDAVSGVCDVLVGPLRDVFSFSGSNAEMKESLVAWGAGSIIYLVVGVVAQSMLRSSLDD